MSAFLDISPVGFSCSVSTVLCSVMDYWWNGVWSIEIVVLIVGERIKWNIQGLSSVE